MPVAVEKERQGVLVPVGGEIAYVDTPRPPEETQKTVNEAERTYPGLVGASTYTFPAFREDHPLLLGGGLVNEEGGLTVYMRDGEGTLHPITFYLERQPDGSYGVYAALSEKTYAVLEGKEGGSPEGVMVTQVSLEQLRGFDREEVRELGLLLDVYRKAREAAERNTPQLLTQEEARLIEKLSEEGKTLFQALEEKTGKLGKGLEEVFSGANWEELRVAEREEQKVAEGKEQKVAEGNIHGEHGPILDGEVAHYTLKRREDGSLEAERREVETVLTVTPKGEITEVQVRGPQAERYASGRGPNEEDVERLTESNPFVEKQREREEPEVG